MLLNYGLHLTSGRAVTMTEVQLFASVFHQVEML
jgi:hypothetical protein